MQPCASHVVCSGWEDHDAIHRVARFKGSSRSIPGAGFLDGRDGVLKTHSAITRLIEAGDGHQGWRCAAAFFLFWFGRRGGSR